MNKRGQALIEFILILPIVIILVLGLIDFGIITYQKNLLENKMNDVIEIYDSNSSLDDLNDYINSKDKLIKLDTSIKNKYITFYLSKKINTITPGLNLIIGNPYIIKIERTTIYES